MGTKANPGDYDCYEAAEEDEPMFILLARDPIAPMLVENWATHRSIQIDRGERDESERAKVKEAHQCARDMREWWDKNRKPAPIPPEEKEPM